MSKINLIEYIKKENDCSEEFAISLLNFNSLVHSGDCTNDVWACHLCMLEEILIGYKSYSIGKGGLQN